MVKQKMHYLTLRILTEKRALYIFNDCYQVSAQIPEASPNIVFNRRLESSGSMCLLKERL